MSIGLAIAGGGLQGIAHIGVLKALEDLNIKIDYISGTSSGSIFAAMYAAGCNIDEMKESAKKYYPELVKFEKRPIIKEAFRYIFKRKIDRTGLIDGIKIENLVKSILKEKNINQISEVKIPLAIPTVDILSTKEVIFLSRKITLSNTKEIDYIYNVPISKAVRASMSFPGIFTTCEFENYEFVDGGTKDNLPVKILKDMGATKTIGVSFSIDSYKKSKNIFSILLRTVDIFSQKDVKAAQEMADFYFEIDNKSDVSLLKIDNLEKCYKLGYDETMKHKNEIFKIIMGKEN